MKGNHWKDSDVDAKIILKWVFKKWDGEAGSGLIWLMTGTGGVHL
jgi:hypothetical protein